MEEKKPRWYHPDSRTLSNLLVVCVGILLYLGLTHLPQVRAVINGFLGVLTPFIAGFAIAYLLNTPANFFARKVFHRTKHAQVWAVVTVYVLALAVISVLLQLILPQVGDSLYSLAGNLSTYINNLSRMVQELIQRFDLKGEGVTSIVNDYEALLRQAMDFLTSSKFMDLLTASAPNLLNAGKAAVNGVVTGLTALIASIYMLLGKDRLIRQCKKLLYALFPARGVSHILSVAGRANTIFVGFINGKLIDSAIIGVLCFVLTSVLSIPYAVLVSVVVGVTNIIPFFGPIIGAVPCLMILVIVDPWAALRFGILIIALQQFDGNILGPKILGDSTGLSAIWVLVAIVVGGGLFGFPGMLLGVPTFAVLYSLMREWADRRLAKKGINADGKPLSEPPAPPTEPKA